MLEHNKSIFRFGQHVKIIHIIGSTKPWLNSSDAYGEPEIGQQKTAYCCSPSDLNLFIGSYLLSGECPNSYNKSELIRMYHHLNTTRL